jgi:restriction endonuclease S subunit
MSRSVYPRYKPSGIEWLGEIPAHWAVRRLKYTASINDEALPETTDPDYEFTYIDIGCVDASKGIVATEKYRFDDAPSRARRIVRDGDTIVSTVRTYLRAIASIREPVGNFIVSTGFAVVRPRALNADYLSYALRSPFFVETVVSRSTGVSYPAINAPEVGNICVPLPSFDEQSAIAAFLDRETARIDALIEKKRRQIELLHEKRSVLISHAVTKGLDPNAKMKHVGIEWLREIPEHWEAKRLRFLVSEPLKYGANESAELDDPTLPRYIRITDVDQNGRLREDTFKSLPEDVARPYLLKEGDLLLARSGATVGKSFFYEPSWGRAAYAGYLIRARFSPARMTPRFVNYFTNSQQYWQWLNSSFIQATIQNVSAEKYANLIMPVPPVDEQRAIAAFLDIETARIAVLIEKVEKSIELLSECRTTLISAAVTGKIDVSKEVA